MDDRNKTPVDDTELSEAQIDLDEDDNALLEQYGVLVSAEYYNVQ